MMRIESNRRLEAPAPPWGPRAEPYLSPLLHPLSPLYVVLLAWLPQTTLVPPLLDSSPFHSVPQLHTPHPSNSRTRQETEHGSHLSQDQSRNQRMDYSSEHKVIGIGVAVAEERRPFCVECRTTATPMWRGGPTGPRSLCNACGIRYRKKRRQELGLDNKQQQKQQTVQQHPQQLPPSQQYQHQQPQLPPLQQYHQQQLQVPPPQQQQQQRTPQPQQQQQHQNHSEATSVVKDSSSSSSNNNKSSNLPVVKKRRVLMGVEEAAILLMALSSSSRSTLLHG